MSDALPDDRVAKLLLDGGYRRIASPVQIAGLEFDVADAFVGQDRSADLVIVGDMAADGERKVVLQVEGIARALDVMRSRRPLTTIVVGPRPVGKALEALTHVGRILPVGEATDPAELRDQLAVLLPLELPDSLMSERDIGVGETLEVAQSSLATALIEASSRGEAAVRDTFHDALAGVLAEAGEPGGADSDDAGSELPDKRGGTI